MCDNDKTQINEISMGSLNWKERIEIDGKSFIYEDLRIAIYDYDIRIWKIKPNGRNKEFLVEINTYPKQPSDCITFA